MDIIEHDVVIVGGGAAGLRAAIAAVETSDRLRVALGSKVYPMRSHTVSAEGGAAAVLSPEDSLHGHAFDTLKGRDYLADHDVVEAPATAWPWPTASARRSRTWRWCSTIRRGCPARAS